jgi:NitT/TauT family transport system substrate-binding protein
MLKIRRSLLAIGLSMIFASRIGFAQPSLEKVQLRLDWTLTGYQLPIYWAAKKGYFQNEGLDVEIKPGAGSQQTINLVGGGHDDIGLADVSLAAVSISRGMKLKAIFGIVQTDAWSVYSHGAKPILKPSDLAGKSVVCVVDHRPLLDLLMQRNKIDASTVQVRTVNAATRNTVFAQRAADGLLGISSNSAASLGGGDVRVMHLSDFGVNLLGQGLIANDDFLKNRPEVARRFIKAVTHAFQDVSQEKNVNEALDIAYAMSGTSSAMRESTRIDWLYTVPRLVSKNTRGRPIGWMSEVDWNDTLKTLKDSNRIGNALPLTDVYTDEFISGNTQASVH